MNRLGSLIKTRRSQEGLSLREFAEIAELSHSYIKNLEENDPRTGKAVKPSIKSLEKISNALSIPLETLLKEVGYIGVDRSFEPSNLRLIRGNRSYQDTCSDIAEKTGNKIDASIYEAVEVGLNTNPSALFVDTLAKYAGVDRSFFYRVNTLEELEYAKTAMPYSKRADAASRDTLHFLNDTGIREFVLNPDNEEYIKLARELKEKDIGADMVRKAFKLES